MLLILFLVLVFSPCVAAYFGAEERESSFGVAPASRPQVVAAAGPVPIAQQVMLDEIPLADDLVIRSFPKGLAQHRILVRDSFAGAKRHIAELRAAAEASSDDRSVSVRRRTEPAVGTGSGEALDVATESSREAIRRAA